LWVDQSVAAAGEPERSRETLSFAEILRATLGVERVGPVDASGKRSGTLYAAGDEEAVGASVAADRLTIGGDRQRRLPLSRHDRATAWRALRPALALDDLPPVGSTRGAAILAAATATEEGEEGWREIEAFLSGRQEPKATSMAVLRARDWLSTGGRTLERLERRRRVAASVGGRVVSGELARVWFSTVEGGTPRALVGTLDRARAEIERHAVGAALGLPQTAVAALVYAPTPILVEPVTARSEDTR
jgi:hypothetical protein